MWVVPTQPLKVPAHLGIDHFAAFPMEMPRRIITGWSPRGVCVECGEGRRPIRGRTDDTTGAPDADAAKVFRRQDEITLDDLRRLGKNGLRRTYDLRNAGHARNFGGEHRASLFARMDQMLGDAAAQQKQQRSGQFSQLVVGEEQPAQLRWQAALAYAGKRASLEADHLQLRAVAQRRWQLRKRVVGSEQDAQLVQPPQVFRQ